MTSRWIEDLFSHHDDDHDPAPTMNAATFRLWGRLAWSAVGLLALGVAAGFVLQKLSLLVVPVLLALFPATLLEPVKRRLERWYFPRTAATLVTLVGGVLLFMGLAVWTVTMVVGEVPRIVDSAEDGVERVEEFVGRVVPGFQVPAFRQLQVLIRGPEVEVVRQADEEPPAEDSGSASDQTESESPDFVSQVIGMALGAVEILTGTILLVVVLFFYLKSGRGMAEGLTGFIAPRSRGRIMAVADEAWLMLGAYFRGQLLVALVDAVLIGIGLVVLGVPLAIPLAAIVFFGGMFPIIGAVVTGALAVLVAFSDGGIGIALAVAVIVLIVQQIEGNVLAPLILSQAIHLHPLVIILSITLGAVVLGVLGAFLSVPAVAVVKMVVERLREGGERKEVRSDA